MDGLWTVSGKACMVRLNRPGMHIFVNFRRQNENTKRISARRTKVQDENTITYKDHGGLSRKLQLRMLDPSADAMTKLCPLEPGCGALHKVHDNNMNILAARIAPTTPPAATTAISLSVPPSLVFLRARAKKHSFFGSRVVRKKRSFLVSLVRRPRPLPPQVQS